MGKAYRTWLPVHVAEIKGFARNFAEKSAPWALYLRLNKPMIGSTNCNTVGDGY